MSNPVKFIAGRLVKRYKRFFADVKLDNDEIVTAHCPNTGSMMGLLEEGNIVYLSKSDNEKRKLKFTLEIIKVKTAKIGVNTHRANRIVEEAIQNKKISALGKKYEFKILKVSDDSDKISLGYKQLKDDPWEKIEEKITYLW